LRSELGEKAEVPPAPLACRRSRKSGYTGIQCRLAVNGLAPGGFVDKCTEGVLAFEKIGNAAAVDDSSALHQEYPIEVREQVHAMHGGDQR
jgi:hypothetical protein